VICFFENVLNSDSGELSTVIPGKFEKLAGIWQTLFYDAMLPAKEIFSDKFRLTKIIRKKKRKK
jgi:hypothetical protein